MMGFQRLVFICRALRDRGFDRDSRREWLQWRLDLHKEAPLDPSR